VPDQRRGSRRRIPPGPGHHHRLAAAHVTPGYVIPPFYDSLLAKVIVRAPDRDAAIARMLAALSAFEVAGVPTTIPMHRSILGSEAFRTGRYDTRSIPGWPPHT
jgi:acetyl-CoA carboxylase biotin carboxylase subunit